MIPLANKECGVAGKQEKINKTLKKFKNRVKNFRKLEIKGQKLKTGDEDYNERDNTTQAEA